MKDKKSIAIVVLAAITAGVGIFSVVNNQSKIDQLAKEQQSNKALETKRSELEKNLTALKANRDALDQKAQDLQSKIDADQLAFSKKEADLTREKEDLQTQLTTTEATVTARDTALAEKTTELTQAQTSLAEKTTALEDAGKELDAAKNEIVTVKAEVEKEKQALATLKADTDAAIAEGKQVIEDLEEKNDTLNQAKGALENKVEGLDLEIAETNKKLERSEGDRSFLERELLRLQDEKAELVEKINSLDFLTAQVKQIKADIAVAKRTDWMKRGIGIYNKGLTYAEKRAALRGNTLAQNNQNLAGDGGEEQPNDTIQVELTSDGKVRINGQVVESAPEVPVEDAPKPEEGNPVAPVPPVGQN